MNTRRCWFACLAVAIGSVATSGSTAPTEVDAMQDTIAAMATEMAGAMRSSDEIPAEVANLAALMASVASAAAEAPPDPDATDATLVIHVPTNKEIAHGHQ